MSQSGYGGEQFVDYEEEINWETVGVPVTIGKYNLVIEKAEYKPTQNNKHMIKVQFKIEGFDPAAPDTEPMIGRTVFTNFNFTQQGGFTVKGFAAVAVGPDGGEISLPRVASKPGLEEWAASIVGARVAAKLKHRTFNEQIQAEVDKYFEVMEVSATEGGVEDHTGQEAEEQDEEQEEEEEEEQETEAAEPEPPKRSLRESVPAAKTAKPNGHTNGKATNGTAPKGKVTIPPAKKTASSKR